jgi:hypothetical protein
LHLVCVDSKSEIFLYVFKDLISARIFVLEGFPVGFWFGA